MPTDNLIREFGPIIILIYAAYYVLPNLVTQVMNIIDQSNKSRATVAQAPYELVKTVLSSNTKSDLIAIELIGLRAAVDRMNIALEQLSEKFEAHIESQRSKE